MLAIADILNRIVQNIAVNVIKRSRGNNKTIPFYYWKVFLYIHPCSAVINAFEQSELKNKKIGSL